MNWKSYFKKDIKNKFKYSWKEYLKYKNTNKVIFLQQAGGKLFSAIENYLMIKYNKKVRSYHSLLKLLKSKNANEKDVDLLVYGVQLHYFFYNGKLQMSLDMAETMYISLYNKVKNMIGGSV